LFSDYTIVQQKQGNINASEICKIAKNNLKDTCVMHWLEVSVLSFIHTTANVKIRYSDGESKSLSEGFVELIQKQSPLSIFFFQT
jgi:hypothetical protein